MKEIINKNKFQNFRQLQAHLDELGLFHMKPGQDRMTIALEKLNLLPLPYFSVQVVGTNGKGSTSTFLSYLSEEHGLKVGLYTSPHFVSPKERILYQNEQISDDLWISCANQVYDANPGLTYFEFLTVLSAQIYKKLQTDIVIFEAGLGGKFDATTALLSPVTLFTPFALDHQSVLGSTLEEISADKARALGAHSKLALSAQQEEIARTALEEVSNSFEIPLHFLENNNEKHILGLKGEYQQDNANLALMAWRNIANSFLDCETNSNKEKNALAKAFIPGRLQFIAKEKSPLENMNIVLDGGHNTHGLKQLLPALQIINALPNHIIFACLEDKEIESIIPFIVEIANINTNTKIYVPNIQNNPRSFKSQELVKIIQTFYDNVESYKSLDECLKYLQNRKMEVSIDENLLICGSLYLLSEFYQKYPQFTLSQN